MLSSGFGVLAYSKQEVEGNVAQISFSLLFAFGGGASGGVESLVQQFLWESNRDS